MRFSKARFCLPIWKNVIIWARAKPRFANIIEYYSCDVHMDSQVDIYFRWKVFWKRYTEANLWPLKKIENWNVFRHSFLRLHRFLFFFKFLGLFAYRKISTSIHTHTQTHQDLIISLSDLISTRATRFGTIFTVKEPHPQDKNSMHAVIWYLLTCTRVGFISSVSLETQKSTLTSDETIANHSFFVCSSVRRNFSDSDELHLTWDFKCKLGMMQ